MKHIILPMALSVSLVALSAPPGHAQMRRSTPTAAPAATATAPAAAARPRTELRIFIGPAFEGGNRRNFTSRTRTTTSTPGAPTGATFTSQSSSSTTIDNSDLGNGFGVMYGVDGTWWGTDRLGLGGSLFGAYVSAGTSTNILPPSPLPSNQTVGANTITVTDTTSISTGFGAGAYTTTLTPVPVGGGLGGLTYAGWSTIPGAGGNSFALRTGTETGANPDTYSSAGGAAYSASRTVWLNEIGMHGEYLLADSPAGGVSFFGGVTIPTAYLSQSFNAKTVGANGSGTVATETQNVDTGAGTYTQRTEYEFNETTRMDGSFVAMGPMIGLNAYYNMTPSTRLYTRLGYAPVLVGTLNSNTVTTVNNRRSVIIENVQNNPAGVTAGTQRWESQTTTPNPSVTSFSGSETMGSIGVGFGLAGLNLFAEGTARGYSMTAPMGPELIYGLKLGMSAGF